MLSETPLMLCIVKRKGENSWRTAFLALIMLITSHYCQLRRSNSSKPAWWKIWIFCMHPLLLQAGKISGPHGREGTDDFSFSLALKEWVWSYTAHPEKHVCAYEETRTTEGTLLEGSWSLESCFPLLVSYKVLAEASRSFEWFLQCPINNQRESSGLWYGLYFTLFHLRFCVCVFKLLLLLLFLAPVFYTQ